MDFEKAKQWLEERINYERMPLSVYNEEALNLEKVRNFLRDWGLDYSGLKIIHVAGSKGKGTTCSLIAEYLTATGYKVGLFTSPHMLSVCERVKVNGRMIEEQEFGELLGEIADLDPELTYFEAIFVLALKYFVEKGVEYVVLEVGLGGRLDVTNIVKPILTILTALELEHTDILGDSLEQIASEKLGIMKPGVPMLVGFQSEEAVEIIKKQSPEAIFVEEKIKLPNEDLGKWKNAQTAYAALELLLPRLDGELFTEIFTEFTLSGRMEMREINGKKVLFDMAHTVSSIRNLMVFLEGKDVVFLFGILRDKKFEQILPMLKGKVYFTSSHPLRGMTAVDLAKLYDGESLVIEDPCRAFEQALEELKRDQVLVVTGSHFLIAEVLEKLKQSPFSH